MKCSEFQLMISKLIDGEVPPGASAPIFAHVATCGECRGFYHRLQVLNASLERLAERGPEGALEEAPLAKLGVSTGRRSWWRRELRVRIPVAMLLIAVAAAGILVSFSQGFRPHEPEAIYITKLPDVVIRAEGPLSAPGN